MPRTRSLALSELKIGVLTIVAIIIAAVLIFTLTGTRGFAWQRYTLKTRFDDVAGLAKGSPVRVAGVEVGSVKDVTFAGTQVDVSFDVRDDMRSRITDRSVAKLGSVSLLGESAVDITPATSGTPIPEFGYVPTGKAAASFADMTAQAGEGISQLTGLIADVRQGKGTLGKLVADDQLYAQLNAFVASANSLTRQLQQGRGTLGKLLNDPKTANSLEASMKNIEDLTRRINDGEGSLGRLLKDDAFAKSLDSATANVRELTDRLNRGEGTAGKLVTDPSLFNRLNSMSDRFDQLIAKLNEGEGTAGRLLKDQELYENMNGAVADFRGLLKQISNDPRKYLNVRVSIF
ncbi:MAG TPA: MlaD family protein [Vicinamibacterales bacterium]|nr:MlaD family protein [Vicinamibacterales bacterium]